MNIVLLSTPGGGKGTQSEKCQQKYPFTIVAPGHLLREHIRQNTELGKSAENHINAGRLAPNDVIIKVVRDELELHKDKKNLLFDGFPRAIVQIPLFEQLLREHGIEIDGVIFLELPREEAEKRIKKRAKLLGRIDDQTEISVATRMQIYEKEIKPVLEFYEKQGKVSRVDGMGAIETVFQRIVVILDNLQNRKQQTAKHMG